MYDQISHKYLKSFMLFLVIITITLWATAGAASQGVEGGDTPQAVFDAARAAGAKNDFTALSKLVAPSERPMMAFGTDMAVGMSVDFYEGEKAPELKKEYEKIQQKYGIDKKDDGEKLQITNDTPQEVIDAHIRKRAQKLYGSVDVPTYVADLMAVIMTLPEMKGQAVFPQDKLSDLKIEGDKATGKSGDASLTFIREGGRWYLTADFMN